MRQAHASFHERLARTQRVSGTVGEEVVAYAQTVDQRAAELRRKDLRHDTLKEVIGWPVSAGIGMIAGYLSLVIVFVILPELGAHNSLTTNTPILNPNFAALLFSEATIVFGLAPALAVIGVAVARLSRFKFFLCAAIFSRFAVATSVLLVDLCNQTVLVTPPGWLVLATELTLF
ncbi:hypothetical protein [Antarctobacter jejuensis]|uniref:hypothetical protein n=1 Tax=Antarctobacter jejuensis TaxID=1439938 RepID=UPI003FCFFD3D